MTAYDIRKYPIHLGLDATAVAQPEFTGDLAWYDDYEKRHGGDGAEGRVIGMYTFTGDWDIWEVHPQGSEVVLCIAGTMVLHQEKPDGSQESIRLEAGQYAINEPGTWHTADIEKEATALFVTAGRGTQHRPR